MWWIINHLRGNVRTAVNIPDAAHMGRSRLLTRIVICRNLARFTIAICDQSGGGKNKTE